MTKKMQTRQAAEVSIAAALGFAAANGFMKPADIASIVMHKLEHDGFKVTTQGQPTATK